MHFHFGEIISHAAETRRLTAGTIIGSGTVSEEGKGFSCLVEKRTMETLQTGEARQPFMKPGDQVTISMRDPDGKNIFGTISQTVTQTGSAPILSLKEKPEILKKMLKQQFLPYVSLAGLAALAEFILGCICINPRKKSMISCTAALQKKFQSVVSGYVTKNYPAIRRITFHKTRTENTSHPDHIKIYFSYSLTIKDNEADSEMVMDGAASLNRKSGNRWLLTDFKVTDSLVEFSKPLVIKALPKKDAAPSPEAAPPPEI